MELLQLIAALLGVILTFYVFIIPMFKKRRGGNKRRKIGQDGGFTVLDGAWLSGHDYKSDSNDPSSTDSSDGDSDGDSGDSGGGGDGGGGGGGGD